MQHNTTTNDRNSINAKHNNTNNNDDDDNNKHDKDTDSEANENKINIVNELQGIDTDIVNVKSSADLVLIQGSIVVVAKCPIRGKSKTRLISLLGIDGSIQLATAMLSDVLKTITECNELYHVHKILLYAPGDANGLQIMIEILKELKLNYIVSTTYNPDHSDGQHLHQHQRRQHNKCDNNFWYLLPMLSNNKNGSDNNNNNANINSRDEDRNDDGNGDDTLPPTSPVKEVEVDNDLQSHDLGAKLQDALVRVRLLSLSLVGQQQQDRRNNHSYNPNPNHRNTYHGHGVVFVGMDAPILPLTDIVQGLKNAKTATSSTSSSATPEHAHKNPPIIPPVATICPANDGGYIMVCVPPTAIPSRTFPNNMYWSHPLTALSQIKAITDQHISCKIGQIYSDIDETNDVVNLCQYLRRKHREREQQSQLQQSSSEQYDDNNNARRIPRKNLDYPANLCCSKKNEYKYSSYSTNSIVTSRHPTCYFTQQVLIKAGLLDLDA